MSDFTNWSQFGKKLATSWGRPDVGDIAEFMSSKMSMEEKNACLLAFIGSQLIELNAKVDLLFDDTARREARCKAAERHDWQSERDERYARRQADIERKVEWLTPVVNRLLERASLDLAEHQSSDVIMRKIRRSVSCNIHKARKSAFDYYIDEIVSCFKGDPKSWKVSNLDGIGEVTERAWKNLFRKESASNGEAK